MINGAQVTAKIEGAMTVLDTLLNPGWESKIDLEKLDMSNCSSCVLGQLFGNFNTGHYFLRDRGHIGLVVEHMVFQVRFTDLPGTSYATVRSHVKPYYEALTLIWKAALRKKIEGNSFNVVNA